MHGIARGLIDSMLDQFAPAATAVSFEEAFTLHHRAVFATARAVLRDSAAAEEVTQEVFLRLYRNLDRTHNPELLRPWLLRVTLNLARDTLRGKKRSMARDAAYQDSSNRQVALPPDAAYEIQVELEQVHRTLAKIGEPMRSCLMLQYHGFSYREIAQTLSLKEINIGSLIARAREKFARMYQKSGAEK